MKPIRTTLAVALLAAPLASQQQNVVVPSKYATGGNTTTGNQEPFSKGLIRYQQSYPVAELKQVFKTPVRLKGVRFRTKFTGNQGFTVDLQMAIGSYKGFLSTRFDDNLKNAAVVYPRNTITLPTSQAGQWLVNLPFNQDFTWDFESNLVIEVRVYGNGNNSQPFLYWFDSFFDNASVGSRQWALNPNAVTATWPSLGGLVTRFDYETGTAIRYGAGCKGEGGHVPEISANGIPVVGNTGLRINLTKAKPMTGAILLWGGSRDKWGAINLPLDLKVAGIQGCLLLVEPLQIFGAVTQGSQPGTGFASVPFGIPPVTAFQGIELFAQWGVVDDSQPSRVIPLSFSNGIWLVIG